MNHLHFTFGRAIPLFTVIFLVGCRAHSPQVTEFESDSALAALRKKYALSIVTANPTFPIKTTHGVIDGAAATTDEIVAYAPLLAFEWNLYPESLIRRSRLKCIVLCKDLTFTSTARSAIPDFEHDTLYLDIVRGSYSDSYVRKVIHHEYYHVIDWRDDGSLQDDSWAHLNPPGFQYGKGGESAQGDSTSSIDTQNLAGFLNTYSMTSVAEDKAEIFAHLMVAPKYLAARVAADAVIRSKVARMKENMKSFCPEMDCAYWNNILEKR
jgi:hypothetical protein